MMGWKVLRWVSLPAATGSLAMLLCAPVAGASELQLSMSYGRVTIHAQDALITDILAEWGRVGNTTIIDADELADLTVTIELVDVPEARALRTLLRIASGYMAAPRAAMNDGDSRFDRILILATSKPAARVAVATVPGGTAAVTPTTRGAAGQRLGVVPSASRGRTPFTVSPAQQEQLDQLQRLLQQPDDAKNDNPSQPLVTPPAFGNVPAARPGMPMGNADQSQETVGVPTGSFGTVDGPTGAFGATPVPESTTTSPRTSSSSRRP